MKQRVVRVFMRGAFALGLILGDCVMGCLWALTSLLLQERMYNFFGA